MKIKYQDKKFSESSVLIIRAANAIIDEYSSDGYELTLRQLYYQFVARGLIPNKQSEYKRLGSIINDARLAGLISWEAIVDRTRNLQGNPHWTGPAHIIQQAADQFQIDKWADQEYRVEVWIEKDALVGIVETVARSLDVSFFSCRGYTSQSEMWAAAQRLEAFAKENDQTPVIIHLGDHDPSGIDMTRDITDRLRLFMGGMEVNRIALNMNQIEKYNPPPNPAKITDSRAANYISIHGNESWELDALDPRVLEELIRKTVLKYRNNTKWNEAVKLQERFRRKLETTAKELSKGRAK